MQAGSQLIQILKAGAYPSKTALGLIKDVNALKGTHDDVLHGLKGTAALTAGHGEDFLFRFVHDVFHFITVLVSLAGDFRGHVDEVSELGLFLDNFRMIADIGGRAHDIGQLGDKAEAAHFVQHIGLAQFLRQRDQIHRLIIVLQAYHGLVDNAVNLPVKIIGTQDFLHLNDGFFFDEHCPQNRLLRFNVLRGYPFC